MMDKTIRNLLIGLAILVILTPLGLLAVGETFGEWGTDWLEENLGYVPSGMQGIANLWSAPLTDYGVSGIDASVGYVVSAILGVILCGGLLYLFGKMIARKEDGDQ
jgi:hypothetical protein